MGGSAWHLQFSQFLTPHLPIIPILDDFMNLGEKIFRKILLQHWLRLFTETFSARKSEKEFQSQGFSHSKAGSLHLNSGSWHAHLPPKKKSITKKMCLGGKFCTKLKVSFNSTFHEPFQIASPRVCAHAVQLKFLSWPEHTPEGTGEMDSAWSGRPASQVVTAFSRPLWSRIYTALQRGKACAQFLLCLLKIGLKSLVYSKTLR